MLLIGKSFINFIPQARKLYYPVLASRFGTIGSALIHFRKDASAMRQFSNWTYYIK